MDIKYYLAKIESRIAFALPWRIRSFLRRKFGLSINADLNYLLRAIINKK